MSRLNCVIKVFLIYILLSTGFAVKAQTTASELQDFLVYASQSIRAHNSDYQGRVGSGGTIEFLNFNVNYGLPAQTQSKLNSSAVLFSSAAISFERGAVTADHSRNMDAVLARGILTTRPAIKDVRHSGIERIRWIAQPLDDQMTSWANYIRYELGRYEPAVPVSRPLFQGRGGLSINHFTINARDFNDASLVSFSGNDRELFVIHVIGRENVNLVGTHFEVNGVSPSQILFFFSDVPILTISASGSGAHTGWGIPGNFLAPETTLIFNRALITGSVWVKRIDSASFEEAMKNPYRASSNPSGQINYSCFPWARLGLTCNCR